MRVIFFLCFVFFTATQAKKMSVDLLYESLCPDSLNFINQQLYPSWKDVSPFIDINFVPFGKSSINTGLKFKCQHGPRECLGNRLQSCALYVLDNQNAKVEFVNCFMNSFRISTDLGEQCIKDAGLKWETIKQCNESNMGIELQIVAEHLTGRFSPRFIPTLLYNGVYNQITQDESLQDFKATVCSFKEVSCPNVPQ